jgi:hypothetical protein
MDILPFKSQPGLTFKTSHAYCLLLVDAFTRFSVIYGLVNKSTDSIVKAIVDHASSYKMADEYGYLDIRGCQIINDRTSCTYFIILLHT